MKIVEIMEGLTHEDQELVAFEVWRSYGNTKNTTLKHPDLNGVAAPGENVSATGENVSATVGGVYRGGRSLPKRRDPQREKESLEVLQFLNLKTGRSYRPVEENLRFIHARLATCSVEDMKGVVARKCREWLNTDMAKYLRPATLFNATRFEQYIGEQSQ